MIPTEQDLVCFAKQRQAQGKPAAGCQDILHSCDIIVHFTNVGCFGVQRALDFEQYEIRKRSLGAFDPTGEHRLPSHECL